MEVTFNRRAYRGKEKKDSERFRLIAVYDEDEGKYHLYITDLSTNEACSSCIPSNPKNDIQTNEDFEKPRGLQSVLAESTTRRESPNCSDGLTECFSESSN